MISNKEFDNTSEGDESSIGGGSIISESFRKWKPTRNFVGPKRSGYLFKMINDGNEWKRRYFETSGFFLTYFKSSKKKKLLAALNLKKVHNISLGNPFNKDGQKGFTIVIEVDQSSYCLLAPAEDDAKAWVRVLSDLSRGISDSIAEEDEGSDEELLKSSRTNTKKKAKNPKAKTEILESFKFICCFV